MNAEPKFELVDDGKYVPVKRRKKKRKTAGRRQKEIRRKIRGAQRVRDWLWDYKKEHPCACGENDPACLDFHHVGDKKMAMSKGRTMGSVLRELPFCIVICANCHRKIHVRDESSVELQMGFEI
jgi:hypothetical protein